MRRLIPALVLAAFVACGGGTPVAPSPTPGPTPAPTLTITAQLVETQSGAAVGTFTTDAASLPAHVTVSQPGFLTRETWVTSMTPTVDLIRDAAPFSIDFFRRFARGTLEDPIQPLRLQAVAPRLYIRTVDNAGGSMDLATLDTVDAAMQNVAATWTGGRFGLAGVERGTETRAGQAGWITVTWATDTASCGSTVVGGGVIELKPFNALCGCNGSRIRPRTAKHELGHAMGFYHTGDEQDLMSGLADARCDQDPSARERYHAAIAYHRTSGNRDVDSD